ncbi:hypothetical protein EV356DRAFT_165018 [Viridothelium virens]|uniref:Uncharacterized protein n=1 Tax=Viridothelium virens TaxID=1048519 RepID=A0A6A6HLY9_VIRVR|nr:hypothetical protein EV356DRAFT_165018 [Viridothelium virens]
MHESGWKARCWSSWEWEVVVFRFVSSFQSARRKLIQAMLDWSGRDSGTAIITVLVAFCDEISWHRDGTGSDCDCCDDGDDCKVRQNVHDLGLGDASRSSTCSAPSHTSLAPAVAEGQTHQVPSTNLADSR